MPQAPPLITLLTDFGDRDWFVASMKGAILTINPAARIVDLTHHIAPHDIAGAAYVLGACYRSFPDGTIHVVVVDPGVGTARRPLLVSTSRCTFVAPDNGVLSHALAQESIVDVRQLEHAQYKLQSAGSTFDGRDVFAPAAAWLSTGVRPESFGRVLHDPVTMAIAVPRQEGQALVGQVVYVDRFGNLISNLTPQHLRDAQALTKRSSPRIGIGVYTIEGLVGSYSEGTAGAPRALINSHGYLEIFVKEGRASDVVKAARGERITIA